MRLSNSLKCPICDKPLGRAMQGQDKRDHLAKCIPVLMAEREAERVRKARTTIQNPDKSGRFISRITTKPY